MKTNYRILHHGMRSWLQFEHNGKWRYVRDDATCVRDCPTTLCWVITPYLSMMNAHDDNFLIEWDKSFPDIQDYFELRKTRMAQRSEYERSVTYIPND